MGKNVKMGKVERISKAICEAAAKSVNKVHCVTCESGKCTMWKSFREEARAAIKAYEQETY